MEETKSEEMKQPTPLWQVISICVTVLIASFTGIIAQSNKISKLEERVSFLQNQQISSQQNVERKFDKIDTKVDAIQETISEIRVMVAKLNGHK